jgi:23S rRNA (guanine2445-N2)-methyltransferase / 23S rRNA (guanine2069-N7)-methyltransferase
LIYFDPPTFSNSKSMRETLDIQRDHVRLLLQALVLLAPGGELFFVTNFQRFKLDVNAIIDAGWHPDDITAQTIDRDFQRSRRIHQCWVITGNC